MPTPQNMVSSVDAATDQLPPPNLSVSPPAVITPKPAIADVTKNSAEILQADSEIQARQREMAAASAGQQKPTQAAPPPPPQAPPPAPPPTKLATLVDPSNPANKVVVPVGSDISNRYTEAGWKLPEQLAAGTAAGTGAATGTAPTEKKPEEPTPKAEEKIEPVTQVSALQDSIDRFSKSVADSTARAEQAQKEYSDKLDQIRNGAYPMTADQNSQIDLIKQQFQSLINTQKLANTNYENAVRRAGISAGRNMYAPEVELGNIQAAINTGLAKISDINVKMLTAIQEAKKAMKDENYAVLKEKYGSLQELEKTRSQNVKDLYSTTKDLMDAAKADHDIKLADQQFEFSKQVEANKPINEAAKAARDFAYEMATKYSIDVSPMDSIKSITEKVQASQKYKQEIAASAAETAYKNAMANKAIREVSGGTGTGAAPTTAESQAIRAQLAATKGLTVAQRDALLNLYDTSGIEGIRSWAYRAMGAKDKETFDSNENAASMTSLAFNSLTAGLLAGPYKSLTEKAKPWLIMQKDQKYVELMSNIELGQAQIRRGLYGTAVTDSEAGMARKFLIEDTDDIMTIRTKLNNNSRFLKFANDAKLARELGLPHPDINMYMSGSGTLAGGGTSGMAVVEKDGIKMNYPYSDPSELKDAESKGYTIVSK